MTVHEAAPPGTLADLLQQLEHLDDEDLAAALGDVEADLRAVYARRAAVIAVVHDRIHEMGHRVSGAVATVAAITTTSRARRVSDGHIPWGSWTVPRCGPRWPTAPSTTPARR